MHYNRLIAFITCVSFFPGDALAYEFYIFPLVLMFSHISYVMVPASGLDELSCDMQLTLPLLHFFGSKATGLRFLSGVYHRKTEPRKRSTTFFYLFTRALFPSVFPTGSRGFLSFFGKFLSFAVLDYIFAPF